MRKGNTFLGGLYKSGQYIGEVYKGNTHLNSFGFPKTVSGNLPLTLPAPRSKPLDSVKIKPYLAQNGITANGKLYKVADGVTLLDSATASGIGFNLDFGITPKLTTKARIVFTPVASNNSGYGGARKDLDYVRFSITTFSSGSKFAFALTANTWPNNKTDLVVGKRYDCTAYNGKQIINGTEYNETALTTLNSTDTTFRICAIDGNGSAASATLLDAKYELYYIWEGDTPVLLAHPAIKNNVVGFYDLVTGTFFSPTVGTLTAGKTTKTVNVHSEIPVDEYQEVTYVAISNNGYIASGVHANPSTTNSRLKVNMTNLSGTTALFGARGGTSSTTRSYNIFAAVTGSSGRFDNVNPSQNFFFTANTWYDIALGHNGLKGTYKVNGGATFEGVQNMSDEDVGEIYIGTLNNVGTPFSGGTPAQWVYVEIAADGINIDCKMYPVKRLSDNAYGMYDLVSRTFHGNDGDGEFTGGSAYQMEVPICSVERSGEKTENLYCDNTSKWAKPDNYYVFPIKIEQGKPYRFMAFKKVDTPLANCVVAIAKSGRLYSEFVGMTPCVNYQGTMINVTFTGDNTWTDPTLAIYVPNGHTLQEVFDSYDVDLVQGTSFPLAHIPYGWKSKTIIGSQGYLEDMGALNWNPIGNGVFYAAISDKANGRNIYCPKYPTDQSSSASATANMHIGGHDGNRIYFKNTNLENTRAAAQADLQGVPLFYQRTSDTEYIAPQVIDTYNEMLQGSVDLVSGAETEEWASIVFDGSDDENWIYESAHNRFYISLNVITGAARTIKGFCSHYKVLSNSEPIASVTAGQCYFGPVLSNQSLLIHAIVNTVEDFKTLLAASPITVWYPKDAPTTSQGEAHTILGHGTTAIVDCAESKQGEASYLSKLT